MNEMYFFLELPISKAQVNVYCILKKKISRIQIITTLNTKTIITDVVQQDTQLLLWLNIYSQYV